MSLDLTRREIALLRKQIQKFRFGSHDFHTQTLGILYGVQSIVFRLKIFTLCSAFH